MPFSEKYCDPVAGDNLNAGTGTGAAALALSGGDWDGTSTYTKAGAIAGVAVGDEGSVFADGAAAPTGYTARVTAVTANTVVLSTTARSGTAPASGTGNRSLRINGAWRGPSGSSAFPFGFVAAADTNAAGNPVRVNLRNNAAYSITASLSHTLTGPVRFQGYADNPGDLGRAVIDGGTSGTSFVLLSTTANFVEIADLELRNNGATGSASGLSATGAYNRASRIVVHAVRGHGFNFTSSSVIEESEAYACNQSNTAGLAGFNLSGVATTIGIRLFSHDHGGTTRGYQLNNGGIVLMGSVADSNGGYGFAVGVSSNSPFVIVGCDSYNNGSDGINVDIGGAGGANHYGIIENCNLVKNGGYGISVGDARYGRISNCGFGAGTQANASGQVFGAAGMEVAGGVTYAAGVTPWQDPANGDFRVALAAAKNAGRGSFLQTQAGHAGTAGYPDIGSAQHQDAGGGASVFNIEG
jgi:hypothetical protein